MKLYAFVLQINGKTVKLNFCFDVIKHCIYLRLLYFIFFPFQNNYRLAYAREVSDISMVYDIYAPYKLLLYVYLVELEFNSSIKQVLIGSRNAHKLLGFGVTLRRGRCNYVM